MENQDSGTGTKPGSKKKLLKIVVIIVVLVMGYAFISKHLSFIGGFPIFKKKSKDIDKKSISEIPLPVKAYKISLVDFTDSLPALGTVKGYREIDLKFAESGYLEYVNFKDGEKVVEGDIIGSLDQREALLKLEYAKNELEKSQKLFDIGSIIELKLNQTKLEYQSARMDYEKTNLIAPYDGYIGTIEVDKGDFVTPNDIIGSFVSLADSYVEFGIIEKDIAKVRIGQPVTLTVDSYPQDVFDGEIESVSPIVEGKSRTFKVKARVTNEDEKLKAGMFGRVAVMIYEKPNALIIPSAAFKKKDDEYFVYVIHPEKSESQPAPEEQKGKKAKKAAKAEQEKAAEQAAPENGAEPEGGAVDQVGEKGKAAVTGLPPGAGPAPAAAGEDEVLYGTVEIRPVQIAYTTPDAVELKAGLEEGELIIADLQQEFEEKARVEVTEVQENIF